MWKHAKVGSIMTSEDIYRRLGVKMNNYPDWYYIKTDKGWVKKEPYTIINLEDIGIDYDLSFYDELYSNFLKNCGKKGELK